MKRFFIAAFVVVMTASAFSCGGQAHVKKDGTVFVVSNGCDLLFVSNVRFELCGTIANRELWSAKIPAIMHAYDEALHSLQSPVIVPAVPLMSGLTVRVVDYAEGGKYAGLYYPTRKRIYVYVNKDSADPLSSGNALIHELHHCYEDQHPLITRELIEQADMTPGHFVMPSVYLYALEYVRWVVDSGRTGGAPVKPF